MQFYIEMCKVMYASKYIQKECGKTVVEESLVGLMILVVAPSQLLWNLDFRLWSSLLSCSWLCTNISKKVNIISNIFRKRVAQESLVSILVVFSQQL